MQDVAMERIAVITDSCGDVPRELAEEFSIFVLPVMIQCKDGSYRDGVEISSDEVYERLKTELPRSSSPLGSDIVDMFEEIKRQGYTHAIAVMLSGGLSSTVNHIRLAGEEMDGLEVRVFDSKSGSIGIGAIALQVAKEIRDGASFAEIVERVPRLIENTTVFFSIDTLEYLQKGGRIGKATALAGAMLQIKPILSIDDDGEIYTADKVRGRKQVINHLIKQVQGKMQEGRPYSLMVADGAAPEEREHLEEKLLQAFPDYQCLYRAKIGGGLGMHLGPGLLGAGIQFLD